MDSLQKPTKRKPLICGNNVHRALLSRKSEKCLSAREPTRSPERLEQDIITQAALLTTSKKNGTVPSLLDKDHPSFVDVDLDFRNIIQEIDTAMQRKFEAKARLSSQASTQAKESPRLRGSPRDVGTLTTGCESHIKDELFQYITHLPMEGGKGKRTLGLERLQGISIPSCPPPPKPDLVHSSVQTASAHLSISCQTESSPPLPPPLLYSPWTYWSPPPYPHASSPTFNKKSKPSPKASPQPSSLSPERTKESQELTLIRSLLSPDKAKPIRKRGELVVVCDSPTMSLSEVFELKRKTLLLRMKERASSIPLHEDKDRERSPQRRKREDVTGRQRWL